MKEKLNKGSKLASQESSNFIELLKRFHENHGITTKENFSALDLLQEGGWLYVKTKDDIDMLVQMCTYQVTNKEVEYMWIEFDKEQPNVKIEINYKDGSSREFDLLTKEDIMEFYP